MANYVKALVFPFTSKDNVKNFVLGGIINAFWFLLIPLFFTGGYLIKIIQNVLQEKEELPSWGKPLDILKHGIFTVFILLAYNIIPILILAFTGRQMQTNLATLTELTTSTVSPFLLALAVIGVIIAAIVWFILPMALVTYAATEDVRQAFNFSEIFSKLRKRLFGYLITYMISILLAALFSLLLLVPIVQFAVGFFMFYVLVFVMHTFSQIYTEAENL
jgi:hypothetical protein